MRKDVTSAGERVVYFDCYSGISGDMVLGALLDCGVPVHELEELLSSLRLPGWSFQAQKVVRRGLSGTDLKVVVSGPSKSHRGLSEIDGIISGSELPATVKEKSIAVFQNLAEAEAVVHGVAVEQIHFHEVGAVDAIIDIVGSVSALYLLAAKTVCCSPLPLGRGTVKTAHGLIPLPGPAVLELLKSRQVPVYGVDASWEMVTPTGAAIMVTLANRFGPPPLLTVDAVGYGAGKFDPGYPNYLRVVAGTAPLSPFMEERVLQIEANVDDQNPEIFGYLMERILDAGALDVYFTSIQMKKNRPAVKLTVLAAPQDINCLLDIIFCESSTLGVRVFEGSKRMRLRAVETVQTDWGPVRVKIVPPAEAGGAPPHFAPEYEDCKAAAARAGLPLKEVYRRVEYLFQRRHEKQRLMTRKEDPETN